MTKCKEPQGSQKWIKKRQKKNHKADITDGFEHMCKYTKEFSLLPKARDKQCALFHAA